MVYVPLIQHWQIVMLCSTGKVEMPCHTLLQHRQVVSCSSLLNAHLPFCANRWLYYSTEYVMPDLQLHFQQQSITAFSRCQIILLSDRGTRFWTTCPRSLRESGMAGSWTATSEMQVSIVFTCGPIFCPTGATGCTDQGEIWQGGAVLWSAPPCQISPWLA